MTRAIYSNFWIRSYILMINYFRSPDSNTAGKMADDVPLSREERLEAWRKRCFLEQLPEDFLRASTSTYSSAHRQPVSAPLGQQRRHHYHPHGGHYPVQFGRGEHFGNIQGYLRITVQQVGVPSRAATWSG